MLINNNLNKPYLTVSVLGRNMKVILKYRNNPIVELNKNENDIEICLPRRYKDIDKVEILNVAINKMYDEIAENEIADAMEGVRVLMGFAPEDYDIKRMKDTFCKCTKNREIVINPDIVKYSRRVIDSTLIQAFCKIKFKTNSKAYKEALENGIERYENYKFRMIKLVKNNNYKEMAS